MAEEKKAGKKLTDAIHGVTDKAKEAVKGIKMPEIKAPDVKSLFAKRQKDDAPEEPSVQEPVRIISLSSDSAVKIMYYLMAADGEIFHSEEEKFNLIAAELDPKFSEKRERLVEGCKKELEKALDPEDYYEVLQDAVGDAILASAGKTDGPITPKLLVWDMLTVAYSDESYNETERKLIKYAVRRLGIEKAEFLELESSILTLLSIEKEIAWIKTTDRPYLTIEGMLNELADRKNVILDSVKELIML